MRRQVKILAALAFVLLIIFAVYTKGTHDGRTGQDMELINQAFAAEEKPAENAARCRWPTEG